MTGSDEEFCGWVIFRHPSDYPKHYVVRQWWPHDGHVLFYAIGVLCDTLEEARENVPVGTIRFPRDASDPEIVVETWM